MVINSGRFNFQILAAMLFNHFWKEAYQASFYLSVDCAFKPTKKLSHDILDLLNKPKIVRSCIFPLANLYFEQSGDYVPESKLLNPLISLCICSGNSQPVHPFFGKN